MANEWFEELSDWNHKWVVSTSTWILSMSSVINHAIYLFGHPVPGWAMCALVCQIMNNPDAFLRNTTSACRLTNQTARQSTLVSTETSTFFVIVAIVSCMLVKLFYKSGSTMLLQTFNFSYIKKTFLHIFVSFQFFQTFST